jgi:lysophospholipase L1-like esterase
MNFKIALLAAAASLLPVAASAQTAQAPVAAVSDAPVGLSPTTDPSITDRPTPKPIQPKKIILVGDSTTQVGSGWGGSFCAYHVTSFVACINLGRGGRSTYSYRAEGSWDVALGEMKAGGYTGVYVLIQFGHNDQPGKAGRSTNLETEFPANLRRYVEETRAAGAVPVLLTPLTRREFTNGKLRDDLAPWAKAVRDVAADMNVPLIDLHARSGAIVQAMGPAAATRLAEIPAPPDALAAAQTGTTIAVPKPVPALAPATVVGPAGSINLVFDYTHLGRAGADMFSAMVADSLVGAVPELRKDIIP